MILLPLALGLATAPFVAKRVPAVYKSETLIMVVPQRIPDSYVKSTIGGSIADRLPSISDQILSRSRLERIINDFGLYEDLRKQSPMEDVVRRMQLDIGPVQIQDGAQSFRVSYVNLDPAVAQKVTARLASLFIDENSRERENLAESTNVFLESQLEEAKARLLEHERKLEEYRRQYSGELPSQQEGNLRAIQTANLQLQSLNESINHASERRLLIERQIADAQTQPAALLQIPGATPDPVALSTAQQLEQAEKSLEVLKLRYTSEFPEVRKLERSIEELRQRVAEEARRPVPEKKTESPSELARQKRIRDLQAELEVIDRQLSVSRAEEGRFKAQIAEYQLKVEAVPKRESELVELTRDYDILKKTYDSLLTKREDSKLARDLERRQIGEQFRILDPASLPVRPSNQNRRNALSLAGAGVGFMLGILMTAFMEYRNSSFAREAEVVRVLDLPVLALVPEMASDGERRRQRHRRLALDLAGSAMLLGTVVFVALGFLRQ